MIDLARLQGFATIAVDGITSALSYIPNQWNHRTYRIAVTGLRRSGKTVFLTSLTHALLGATKGTPLVLPFFPFQEKLLGVSLTDIPGVPRFPFQERLSELLGDPPEWPKPTVDLTGLRIRLRHTQSGWFGQTTEAIVDVDLIDYPGEWILDLPMLTQDFHQWSDQMEELCASGDRARVAQGWQEKAKTIDPDAKLDESVLAEVGDLYVAYLQACRNDLNLFYLQPGRFVMEGLGSVDSKRIFFPMSSAQSFKRGSNGAALQARYAAYQAQVREFYSGVFGQLRRQVVLVDLLTALELGRETFTDLGKAVRAVSDAYEDLRHPLMKMLPTGSVDRLAIVATKADHVTSDQHNNLLGLLHDMIGQPFIRAKAGTAELFAVASVCSTTEVWHEVDEQDLPFLSGTQIGRTKPAVVRAGVIPGKIPSPAKWNKLKEFKIRRFQPPKIDPTFAEQPLPNVNLDKVLQFLLA